MGIFGAATSNRLALFTLASCKWLGCLSFNFFFFFFCVGSSWLQVSRLSLIVGVGLLSTCGLPTVEAFAVERRLQGFRSCSAWAALLLGMWKKSSRTRDWIHVPCTARRILNHWTTREVLSFLFQIQMFKAEKCNLSGASHLELP